MPMVIWRPRLISRKSATQPSAAQWTTRFSDQRTGRSPKTGTDMETGKRTHASRNRRSRPRGGGGYVRSAPLALVVQPTKSSALMSAMRLIELAVIAPGVAISCLVSFLFAHPASTGSVCCVFFYFNRHTAYLVRPFSVTAQRFIGQRLSPKRTARTLPSAKA